ncbi:alpha/beta hydrolase family esterase [Ruegeria profundi]|uniref:Phospholipase/carboxylesterase/thioesterase domain-containing protein n=1 Tax=Ruegeria profundi TaxID=1685378 RepID=A0A0X3TWN3_9RHOB|nr:PHB depolymerase family esterase [Ruegeria profundi]KUJ80074.1 hypothetical protein AVO44_07880 [Ruegeria profundi]
MKQISKLSSSVRLRDAFPRFTLALIALALAFLATQASARQLDFNLKVDGVTRTAKAYVPDGSSPQAGWPIIVALHPGFATGEIMAKTSRLHSQDGSSNYVVVYPDGVRRSWNAGECCAAAQRRQINDVGYILSLVEEIGKQIPLNGKVFLAGYSNGALMAYRIACSAPDRITAFSVYAGAYTMNTSSCNPAHTVPLLHLHGELDAVAPLRGGESVIETAGKRSSVLQNIDYWVRLGNCDQKQSSSLVQGANCTRYSGCKRASETLFCIYPGQGHYWPGAKPTRFGENRGLGPARTDIDGGSAMIRFFDKYR